MITPVRNISLKNLYFNLPKKTIDEPKDAREQIKIDNFKSIYNNSISFTGYYTPTYEKPYNFAQTVYENWFQLPQIELEDGSKYQFMPDETQLECAKKLYEGNNVILDAPTGTGKTALAHWAITKNLNEDKKTYYTTPLVALANDKFREFCKIYGEENVGLLTGEQKINTHAPILIMTTEIYNIQASNLYKNTKGIGTVIFDEAHYLGDEERGNVWENSILKTPLDKIQILALSATIGNSEQLASWVQSLSYKKAVSLVKLPPQNRYVPLVWKIYNPKNSPDEKFQPIVSGEIDLNKIDENALTSKQKRAMEMIFKSQNPVSKYYEMSDEEYSKTASDFKYTFWDVDEIPLDEPIENISDKDFKEITKILYPKFDEKQVEEFTQLLIDKETKITNRIHVAHEDNDFPKLVKDLKNEDMLPALIFRLSRSACANTINDLKDKKINLTTDEEKEEIANIIAQYKAKGAYFGKSFDETSLLNGYAYHHAGILPQYKKLVEELFSKKLIKVVAATATLSAGINMPARTVVITDTAYQKYDSKMDEIIPVNLTANEFHQMAGRGGRRGIDTIGNVVLYNLKTPADGFRKEVDPSKLREKKLLEIQKNPDELQTAYNLLDSQADSLRSNFKPEWCMCAQYWAENNTEEQLESTAKNSFKMFLSKNPEKEQTSLLKKFQRYNDVLAKRGFIKTTKGETTLTPKGQVLKMSQGMYPLALSEMIFDEHLKDIKPMDLCQIVGYIAGAEVQEESLEASNYVKDVLAKKLQGLENSKGLIKKYQKNKEKFENNEAKLLRVQKECMIPPEDVVISNSYGGYITYLWAILNNENSNSIKNFQEITRIVQDNKDEQKNEKVNSKASIASKEYNRFVMEGRVYKLISQSISVLKQICSICDYALSNEKDFPNQEYYLNLYECTESALELMKHDPIFDEFAV